ncbi:MAG: hypothetical protein HQL82_13530 [Magnetococcales bacterium]|nr:hypothetical protein [Magnetococcales bacterium]
MNPDPAPAMARAEAFLRAAQEGDGGWRDYRLPPGESWAWTTALVGLALALEPVAPASRRCLERAVGALRTWITPRGWGYNPQTACDADSTAWSLWLLSRLGALEGISGTALLAPFLTAEGSVRTFADPQRFGAWAHPHEDVAPVVGLALAALGAEEEVTRIRRELCRRALARTSGEPPWQAFWWDGPLYAVTMALTFLERTGGVPAAVRERVLAWEAPPGEGAFDLALRWRWCLFRGRDAGDTIAHLLALQGSGGGWSGTSRLRIPTQFPGEGNGPVGAWQDIHGLLSTAMVLLAWKGAGGCGWL